MHLHPGFQGVALEAAADTLTAFKDHGPEPRAKVLFQAPGNLIDAPGKTFGGSGYSKTRRSPRYILRPLSNDLNQSWAAFC